MTTFFSWMMGLYLLPQKSFDSNINTLHTLFLAITTCLFKIGIIIKFNKLELIHFYRKHISPSSLLALTVIDPFSGSSHTLPPKDCICLLSFYLDSKLSFCKHVSFYCHSSHSFLHSLSTMGTASKDLDVANRCLFYMSCVIPLLTYRFQLWFNPSFKSCKAHLKSLNKVQLHVA